MNKVIISTVIIILISSCQRVGNNNNQTPVDSANANSQVDIAKKIREVYHRFPTPEEMLSHINMDSITYNPRLVNSCDDIHQYIDSRSQAINLGIYGADLAYLTIFNKRNEAIKYFESIYELSDKLRISSAFERSLLIRFQENMDIPDSLKVMTEEAFKSLSNYLESNNNGKTFALISIGGFVEALYLSFNFIGEYDADNPIIQQIADQKNVLENIINYSEPFLGDKSIAKTIEELKGISDLYEELSVEEIETKVSRDAEGKLIIEGGSKLSISEEQYLELKKITSTIRKSFTQN